MRSLCVLAVVALVAACPVPQVDADDTGDEGEGEGEGEIPGGGCTPDTNTGFPPPLTTSAPRVGSPTTFDVGAWNIRNFPARVSTPALVADAIASMDLDFVAVVEIADEDRFAELMKRLPDHEGVLSTHTYSTGDYQKIGFIYRCGLLTPVGAPQLPFSSDGFNFPRPPLQQRFRYQRGDVSFEFTALAVHFKANEGNNDTNSAARRRTAFERLATYVDSLQSGALPDEVLVLGDFNETINDTAGRTNWTPFLDESKYVVRTKPLAEAGEASFLSSSGAMLDHIVTTRGFDDEVGAGTAGVQKLEQVITNYRDDISDHRPVTLIMRGAL